MRMITLAIMFAVLGVWHVQAQTFAPEFETGKVTNNAPETVQVEDVSAETPQKAKDDDEPLIPAQINIGDKEPEKEYDNTLGHVVEYKYVNGKIVFGNPDDRKVLIFTDNYQVAKGMDGIVKCSLRVYVLNDMKERINNLSFKLIWPEIRTSIQMHKVNQGVKTYKDIMLLGEGCFSMDKTPTVEVNRCRVKGKTQEQCAEAVRWFKR